MSDTGQIVDSLQVRQDPRWQPACLHVGWIARKV